MFSLVAASIEALALRIDVAQTDSASEQDHHRCFGSRLLLGTGEQEGGRPLGRFGKVSWAPVWLHFVDGLGAVRQSGQTDLASSTGPLLVQ